MQKIQPVLKALSCVLCALGFLVAGALGIPAAGYADGPVSIWAGGVELDAEGYLTTDASGSVAKWDGSGAPADHYIYFDGADEVVLHNASVQSSTAGDHGDAALHLEGSAFTVVLEGSNAIDRGSVSDSDYNPVVLYGVRATGALTVAGSGSLRVDGGDVVGKPGGMAYSYGINAGELRVDLSGSLEATGGQLDIQNAATTMSVGLYAVNSMRISGGIITARGGDAPTQSHGVYVSNDNLVIAGGALTAQGGAIGAGGSARNDAVRVDGQGAEITASPAQGMTLEVKAGSDEGTASAIPGSPFTAEQDIAGAAMGPAYFSARSAPAVTYPVFVKGIQATSANASDILGDGTVRYDPDTSTLTLDNASITAEGSAHAIFFNFTGGRIRLIGANALEATQPNYRALYVINNGGSDAQFEIVGEQGATIAAHARESEAVQLDNTDLSIDGCTVQAASDTWGALWVNSGSISIEDSSVTAKANVPEGNTVYSDGSISISASTVKVTGAAPDAYPALYAAGDIVLERNSVVTAESEGTRGLYTDSQLIVRESSLTACGTTHEGACALLGTVVENGVLIAKGKPNDEAMPALYTSGLEVSGTSGVSLFGGLGLYSNDGPISMSIAPAEGAILDFKVDPDQWSGSASVHFDRGDAAAHNSPYRSAVEFTDAEMNWMSAYRFISIGAHAHSGGAAACTEPAQCVYCGEPYGDPAGHADPVIRNAKEATCAEEGYTGDAVCPTCGMVLERGQVIPKLAHAYQGGVCIACGAEEPDVTERPGVTKKSDSDVRDGKVLARTGDPVVAGTVLAAAVGTVSLAAARVVRRRG